MKKIYFCAPHLAPGGPNEVNRNIIKCLKDDIYILREKGRLLAMLDIFAKICISKVIVISGGPRSILEMRFMRFLKKTIIYIMHGCASLESGQQRPREDYILKHADLILCVSDRYRKFMQNRYPQYAQKMDVLYNGINWEEYKDIQNASQQFTKDKNRIILFGGGRLLKNNYDVCLAVQRINEKYDLSLHVDVYGYYRENDASPRISQIPCVKFHGVIPHEDVINELAHSYLFIQNSDYESFGLGIIDALNCGCSVLISHNIGVLDIMGSLTPHDVIEDPHNVDEIVEKILHLLNNANNERLMNSICKRETSIQHSADVLMNYCKKYV